MGSLGAPTRPGEIPAISDRFDRAQDSRYFPPQSAAADPILELTRLEIPAVGKLDTQFTRNGIEPAM
jgi:hypothetical protein